MRNRIFPHTATCLAVFSALCFAGTAVSQSDQERRPRERPNQPPAVTSPEVSSDRKITFRIHAPEADTVRLNAGDIPGIGRDKELKKQENGVWAFTTEPVPAGAYRYTFLVDNVQVLDSRNPSTSESNTHAWSLVEVAGADFLDTRNVPHGAVAEVTYYSNSLNRSRRMHVYTPPGYETSQKQYPIFYLLHGAFDSDDSWSTVGRAGFILDNLIADGNAKPMVVVMPDGHTGPFRFGSGLPMEEFLKDFENDIMPHVEDRYRILKGREHRAIAGLSMGGAHTLNIALPQLDKFAYIGVYSSGIFGITGRGPGGNDSALSWEERHQEILDNEELKDGLKLFWFATGKDDFLLDTTRATVEMFKNHGFEVTYEETAGGHTWLNWRDYLHEFVPMLFQ